MSFGAPRETVACLGGGGVHTNETAVEADRSDAECHGDYKTLDRAGEAILAFFFGIFRIQSRYAR